MTVPRRLGHSISGIARNCGVLCKVRLLLLALVVFPLLALLIAHETNIKALRSILSISLVVSITGLVPVAKLITYLLVGRDLEEIASFCNDIKQGNYSRDFELPNESDEEHQVIRLKRDLRWMAHVIGRRESCLQSALEGAHKDKVYYENLSSLDSLTGLANRGNFEKRLLELAQDTERYEGSLTLLFIDCDNFKAVNDCNGHQAGDALLKSLAGTIMANVRECIDLPFRYGGDEFGVIYAGMRPEQAAAPAERIKTGFNEQNNSGATLSMGIAGYVSQGPDKAQESAEELIRAADKALYDAKAQGGDRIQLARPSARGRRFRPEGAPGAGQPLER